MVSASLAVLVGCGLAEAAVLAPRQSSSNTATVDLAASQGTPQHLASGVLYGIPAQPDQIPSHFYTDIGFNYNRAGGAQLSAPGQRGWTWGFDDYRGRFFDTLSNYHTTRQYGGSFIILPHDIWGTDQTNSSSVWPGDNGDWTDYGRYLDQLFADMQTYGMIDGVVFDIWNEPEGSFFWARSQQQWLDLYKFSHQRLRSTAAVASVLISGPTLAAPPTTDNTWWTNWLQLVKDNDLVPDQYAWHLEGNTNDANDDLQTNLPILDSLLGQYGLPQRVININEYAVFDEQVPSAAAWWIARLERYNAIGLRGNWLSSLALHDYLASLVSKPNANTDQYSYTAGGYFANGEWQVYKYYATNMTGARVQTAGSTDRLFDVYATVDGGKARILAGTRLQEGTWYITVDNLSAVGLPESGTLSIQTYGFVDNGHYGQVGDPSDRGVYGHAYSGNSVTFPVYQVDSTGKTTAWAFEFQA